MRAVKVQINASNSCQPERFKTVREAQEAADECNIPGEIYQVIVGCCGPQYYVLLIDEGEIVKYYSALSEAWIPVSVKVAKTETEEPELQEAGAEKQGEGDSMNEEELTVGKEQINTTDAMAMDFLWNLAREEGYEVSYRWKEYGCLKHRKTDKGRIVFAFEGPRELPEVRTERGEYCFGGHFIDSKKTNSFIDKLYQLFNLRMDQKYVIPAAGRSSCGPVLSMDMDEMLLICQQVGRGKRCSS